MLLSGEGLPPVLEHTSALAHHRCNSIQGLALLEPCKLPPMCQPELGTALLPSF